MSGHAPDPDLVKQLGVGTASAAAGAILTMLGQWWRGLRKAPADATSAAADLQTAVNQAVTLLVSQLQHQVDELAQKVEELTEANDHCKGENRQMAQRIESLARILERNGITVPEATAPGAFLAIEGARATVLRPSSDAPPKG